MRTCTDVLLDLVIHAISGTGVEVTTKFEGFKHGTAHGHEGMVTETELCVLDDMVLHMIMNIARVWVSSTDLRMVKGTEHVHNMNA